VYPDVSVVCGQPELVSDGTDVIANPTVIVEVLSDATELFDRGEKFRGYRAVPSVIDYVLVAHNRVRVEHYTRGPEDFELGSEGWPVLQRSPSETCHAGTRLRGGPSGPPGVQFHD
jgi:Uma2 family endonuclease